MSLGGKKAKRKHKVPKKMSALFSKMLICGLDFVENGCALFNTMYERSFAVLVRVVPRLLEFNLARTVPEIVRTIINNINPFRTAISFWGQLGTNYLEFD